MIQVLTGSNDFARAAELSRLTADFIQKYGDFGLEKLDASEVEFNRLLESVSSLPFLAPRRMVIVSNPGSSKPLSDGIEQLLDNTADTTDLIFVEGKFDKRLSLYKTLKKKTEFKEFNALDERGLAQWLVSEAKARGGSLSPADAAFLVQRVGLNQLGLHHELDKLLAYDPRITRESIELLVEPLPQSSMFDLLDAAFAGNHKRALALYQDQRAQQVEPQAIMGMLAWQLHIIAVVKMNENLGPEGLASAAKLNPYVVRKTLGLVRGLSQKQVKDLVARALALDIRLKSETIDADDAVQAFLLSL